MPRPYKLELCKSPVSHASQPFWWRVRRGKKVLTSETYKKRGGALRALTTFAHAHSYVVYTDLAGAKPVVKDVVARP